MKSLMIRYTFAIVIIFFLNNVLIAQDGYHFGAKGGITLANQNWNENDRSALLAFHGNVFIESRDLDDRGALFAQIGLHTRGSSIRNNTFAFNTIQTGYRFQNASLMVGARRVVPANFSAKLYYSLGLRAEYTLSNNLEQILVDFCSITTTVNRCPFPDPIFINHFNYGLTVGGGFEFLGTDFFTPAIEFSISPDVSFQYDRPELPNLGLSQTRIRNISFEISLVLKFLREIVYVE